MKMSIRLKIILVFSLLISLILIFQIFFNTYLSRNFYITYKENTMKTAYEEIVSTFDGTAESVSLAINNVERQHNLNILVWTGEDILYTSYDKYFSQISNGELPRPDDFIREDIREEMQNAYKPNLDEDRRPTRNPFPNNKNMLENNNSFMFEDQEVFVYMFLPMDSIEDSVAIFSVATTRIITITFIIGIIVCIFISKSITKPIKEMEATASKLSNLDFSSKVDENISSIELSNLARNINSMSLQLEDSINELNSANEKLKEDIDYQKRMDDMRKEFVGNVSHEMKTPLAVMRMYAENLKLNIENIDREYYCDTIIEETESLSDLVTSMLNISSIESGLAQMHMERFNISEFVENLIDKLSVLSENREIQFFVEKNIFIVGDEKYLEQAMKNFIINAIDHTDIGGKIKISLKTIDDKAEFSVFNEGKNISDEDMKQIWDSFYRSDKARNRKNNNVGLGLHIVKTIIEKHTGEYGCKNISNGVEFYLKLNM